MAIDVVTLALARNYTDSKAAGLDKAFRVVNALPEEGETKYIYLVPKSSAQTNNKFDEYIWTIVSEEPETYGYEKIGDTEIDLSSYVQTSRTINNKALSSDITLNASDVNAVANATGQSITLGVDSDGIATLTY